MVAGDKRSEQLRGARETTVKQLWCSEDWILKYKKKLVKFHYSWGALKKYKLCWTVQKIQFLVQITAGQHWGQDGWFEVKGEALQLPGSSFACGPCNFPLPSCLFDVFSQFLFLIFAPFSIAYLVNFLHLPVWCIHMFFFYCLHFFADRFCKFFLSLHVWCIQSIFAFSPPPLFFSHSFFTIWCSQPRTPLAPISLPFDPLSKC